MTLIVRIHITKNDTGSSDKPSGIKDRFIIGNVEHTYGTEDRDIFKIIACKLVAQSGKVTATITLSSDGYDRLFLGSEERSALKADDSNLIYYKVDGNGKYTYTFLAPYDQNLAARSHGYEAGTKKKCGMTIPLKFT